MSEDKREFTPAERTALVAISTNVLLTLLKFILAAISGSLALLAEAFHSFADIGSSFAVFVAIRAESREHKSSSIIWKFLSTNPQRKVAILIGVFLLIVSISIFSRVFTGEAFDVIYPVPVGVAMLVLALFSFLLSRLEKTVGEKTDATALLADSHHARVDMYASILVAVALLGEGLTLSLDRLAAGVISFFVFLQAINVFIVVFRDLVKKEKDLDYLYPHWLTVLMRERYPKWKRIAYGKLARVSRINAEIDGWEVRVDRLVRVGIILLIVVGYFLSGFYTVEPYQLAIEQRFGEPLQTEEPLGPGLHYRLPWPIDTVTKLDSRRVERIVIGTEISPESKMYLWTNVHYIREFNLLSGENIFVDTGMIIHYRISSPYEYLYVSSAPVDVMRELSYGVLLKEIAKSEFFDLVTTRRDSTEAELAGRINNALRPYRLGLEIVSVNLRDIHPPTNVAPDFEGVVSAAVDYETYINEAHGYGNFLIPEARGEAAVMIEEAKAKKNELVHKSTGESNRFSNNLAEYRRAPTVNKHRYFLETAEQVLSDREKYIVPPETSDDAIDLYLIMDSPASQDFGGAMTQ
jgi:membrane protease subunit HflK